jgi:hypothetical protein
MEQPPWFRHEGGGVLARTSGCEMDMYLRVQIDKALQNKCSSGLWVIYSRVTNPLLFGLLFGAPQSSRMAREDAG